MSQTAYELQSSIDTLITLAAQLESDLLAASNRDSNGVAAARYRVFSSRVNALRSLARDVRRLARPNGNPDAVARVREARGALARNADATLLAMSSLYLVLGYVGDLVEYPQWRDKVSAQAKEEARRADARLRAADAERSAAAEYLESALLHLGERAQKAE